MLDEIAEWVKSEPSLGLSWGGDRTLEFHDGRHYYRMLSTYKTTVALMEGFNRWGPDTRYYMDQLPHSKESLMKLVQVCNYLSDEMPGYGEGGTLDIGPLV